MKTFIIVTLLLMLVVVAAARHFAKKRRQQRGRARRLHRDNEAKRNWWLLRWKPRLGQKRLTYEAPTDDRRLW